MDEYDMDPIRSELVALAYLAWGKKEDLPQEIEDAIDDIMEMIEDTY